MSSRPLAAAADAARSEAPSRRHVVAAIAAAPAVAAPIAGAGMPANDEAVATCEKWLALHAENERLSRRWRKIEAVLVREHNWFKLTERQKTRLPEAQELYDIEERQDALHEEIEALLALLPTAIATSPKGIAAKLAVTVIEVDPEENELAHNLIASALRDFKALAPAAEG